MANMRLIEETHTYVNDDNPSMLYTSVTTVVHKYAPVFDEDFYAQKVADRDGKTKEQVLAEWKEINTQANIFGTEFHAILERYLLARRLYVPRNDFEQLVINEFEKLNLIEDTRNVKPEYIMEMPFYGNRGLAGTADVIEDINYDHFNVLDFKTNKRFNYSSPYFDYLDFPVDHLQACQYNEYALQLSVYGVMYEKETGKKANRFALLYWDRHTSSFEVIPIPYMKKEAEAIIEHFKIQVYPTIIAEEENKTVEQVVNEYVRGNNINKGYKSL